VRNATIFHYSSGYNIAQTSSTWINGSDYSLTRGALYILLPLSVVVALLLVSQGVVQTFGPYQTVSLLQPTTDANGNAVTEQVLALGPAASQIAIKQLGTNGAVSSTSTRRTRSRTQPRSPTLWKCCPSS
jgi:K+-transporting ATPase A subunit